MMETSIARRLLAHKRAAAAEADALCQGLAQGSPPETFYQHLRRYILSKYLLDEAECAETDDIAELTEISLAKSQRIDRKLLEDVDRAAGCTSATSAMRKKVLLYIAMERELDIRIPAEAGATVSTVRALAGMIQRHGRNSSPGKAL